MKTPFLSTRSSGRWFGWFAVILLAGMLPVLGEDLKALPGHVPAGIARLKPLGRVSATNRLRMAIGLPLRDQAGLARFAAEVSDPASPNFRRYATREELTGRFGPTVQDYEAVKTFARANGLTIEEESSNRLLLDVSGPAASVEKAFHFNLLTYRHPNEDRNFFAPDREPRVAVGLPVVDIQGLSDYSRPRSHLAGTRRNPFTIAPGGGTAPNGNGTLFGNDFRAAYVPGVTNTGAGQIVGLFQADNYYAADIAKYASAAGGGRTNIVVSSVMLDGYNGAQGNGNDEVSLDIEMVMSMAPGLSAIVCFEGNPDYFIPNHVLNRMLSSNNISTFSSSWSWSDGPSATTDAIFILMGAAGQTYLQASGDTLAYPPGDVPGGGGVDDPQNGTTPCSSPYVTVVGGTTLSMAGVGASWASEIVWNWQTEYGDTGFGSSGGVSTVYSLPSWQGNIINLAGRGGSATNRNIPDVAANADHTFIYAENGGQGWVGGTSCAAPLWAGFMALVNQQSALQGGESAGFINPAIYALASGTNYTNCFHDVTSGNNTNSRSPTLFYATNNYDLCTGVGSMGGSNLISVLAGYSAAFTNLSLSKSIIYVANAGTGTISVVATNGTVSTLATGFNGPEGLVFDRTGNLYVSNYGNNTVSKVTRAGAVTTYAAGFNAPQGLAFDSAGNLYVSNYKGNTVSKVTTNGVVSTFASGFNGPAGLVFDSLGNLYVANVYGANVSKVTPAGAVSTFFGSLSTPEGLAFDTAGNLYVSSVSGNGVWKVAANGAVAAFASGISAAGHLAFDGSGNLYVTSISGGTVSRVTPGGTVTTYASGFSTPVALAVQNPAVRLQILLPGETNAPNTIAGKTGSPSVQTAGTPFTVTVNAVDGNWVVAPGASPNVSIASTDPGAILPAHASLVNGTQAFVVTLVTAGSQTLTATDTLNSSFTGTSGSVTVTGAAQAVGVYVANAGTGTISLVATNGTVSTLATGFNGPEGLAFDPAGNLYVANYGNNKVSKVTPSGAVTTFASGFNGPQGMAFDSAGNLYVANYKGNTVSMVSPAGVVSTFASGFNGPAGLVFDNQGNLYVANVYGANVSKVTPGGVVTTLSTRVATPEGLAFDITGNLYISSVANNQVWKVTTSGVAAVFAGGISAPGHLAFDGSGNLYVTSISGGTLSKVAPGGTVTTYASGFSTPVGLAIQNPAVGLQFLLHGEINSPNTLAGKTGSPSPQMAGTSLSVTVNPVDGNGATPLGTDSPVILTISGTIGAKLQILVSSDLADPAGWTTLTNFTLTSSPLTFADPSGGLPSSRYYQVIKSP